VIFKCILVLPLFFLALGSISIGAPLKSLMAQSSSDWPNLQLKVLPYSDGLLSRLRQPAHDIVDQAKKDSTLDQVTVVVRDQVELKINSK
jgi:hypothetical protein